MKLSFSKAALGLLFSVYSLVQTNAFELKQGDLWVMAGDSITAQRLHSNYIEAFLRTRYPELGLQFRNAGVSGNRAADLLKRFDYDVAAWKPTVVSIELGMNDTAGAAPLEAYVTDMKELAVKLKALNVRPIFISSSPVNDGSLTVGWISERNRNIRRWTDALQEMAQKEGVPVIDQYGHLVDFWGKNQILLDATRLADRAKLLQPTEKISGLAELQAFAKAWAPERPGIALGGDAVHPGPIGQYTMAAVILKELGVDPEVSSATLNANGTLGETRRCTITEISSSPGELSFTRLDERQPWPIAKKDLPDVLKIMPEITELSRYMLCVKGLPEGSYSISMDGEPVTTASRQQLEEGINLGVTEVGPIAKRAQRIYDTIDGLQAYFNQQWRNASKEGDREKQAAVALQIEEKETLLRQLSQPEAIRYRIVREEVAK